MSRMLVILGPTATGKTDLALRMANFLNGEIVSADSRQVYKGLDIGTGKLPNKNNTYEKHNGYWIIDDTNVWLYDVFEPSQKYSVANYIKDASSAINLIVSKKHLPILVGGTGFYIKGLLEGIPNLGVEADSDLRDKLRTYSKEKLQKYLQQLSFEEWNRLNDSDKKNPRRLLRRIEVLLSPNRISGNTFSPIGQDWCVLKIGLYANRQKLNEAIDKRVDRRINQGLIDEGRELLNRGLSLERMRELGLEYGCLADLLESKVTEDEFRKTLKIKIHQYAKRQMTWFQKDNSINWFDITQLRADEKIEMLITDWYNQRSL